MGPGGHVYGGVISTFSNLLHKEGISSMYVGLLPAVISMAPAGAVFYGVYDLLKVTLRTRTYQTHFDLRTLLLSHFTCYLFLFSGIILHGVLPLFLEMHGGVQRQDLP